MHPSNPRSHVTTHCSLDSCTKRSFGVCAPPLLAVTADRKTRQTAAYFIFDPLIKTLSAFSPVTMQVKARQRIYLSRGYQTSQNARGAGSRCRARHRPAAHITLRQGARTVHESGRQELKARPELDRLGFSVTVS